MAEAEHRDLIPQIFEALIELKGLVSSQSERLDAHIKIHKETRADLADQDTRVTLLEKDRDRAKTVAWFTGWAVAALGAISGIWATFYGNRHN